MENDLYSTIYGRRVLVFLEVESTSNKYNQVCLTPKQFKNMTATLCEETGREARENVDEVSICLSDEEYDLPDLRQMI